MMWQCAVLLFLILNCEGDKECNWGQYGEHCKESCPENCRINELKNLTHCQRETGRCSDGCKHGWYGHQCDHTCSNNCPGNVCNQETGHCTNPCDGKTTGDFCENAEESVTKPSEEEIQNVVTTIVVPVIISFSLLLLLLCISIVTYFKRCKKPECTPENPNENAPLIKDSQEVRNNLQQHILKTSGRGEEWFVKTAAYKEVRDQLQQHNLVMLTGGPGEGKTTIGHMLCCDYQQQGYNTVFYSREEDFNMDVFQATEPTFIMCDEPCKLSKLTLGQIRNATNKILFIQTNYKILNGEEEIDVVVDITQIGMQNWDRTKQEYSQMLQMQTDIPSDTREEIIANLPSYVGFPKVMKQFCEDRPTNDHVAYFAHPHSHFRTEIEKVFAIRESAARIINVLLPGADEVLYSLFPGINRHTLSNFKDDVFSKCLYQRDDTAYFCHPFTKDVCEFYSDVTYPGFLLKSKPGTISTHNTGMFLTQLVEDTRRGKFRHTIGHPVLSREDNIDRFMAQLGDSFVDVLHLQDSADSPSGATSFLYWVLQSGNDYLCQKVLQKQELSQVHVSEALACCIRLHDAKSFLYLRKQLLGLQRPDVTYAPDYTDADGNSLLMMAVNKCNTKTIKQLLEDDANCGIRNNTGNTALHFACIKGFVDVFHSLYDHVCNLGNDPGEDWKNLPGQHLRTPVMMAALKGNSQLYEYLADEEKCKLAGGDDNGDTILHLACHGGCVEIVKDLISRNLFDINSRGQYGQTPLMIATHKRHRDVLELLLSQNCHISPEDFSMLETLSYGHLEDSQNAIQFLQAREHNTKRLKHKKQNNSNLKTHLEKKASSISQLPDDESNPHLLHTAAKTGNLKLAEFLLSKGKVNINTRDASGRTPVMLAAAGGHLQMFKFLMDHKCELTLKDTQNKGSLHYACQGGNISIVKALVHHDVNERDNDNKTPLCYSVEGGHKDIFETLMDIGGDLSTVDTGKNTLLHLASKGGNLSIVEFLINHNMFQLDSLNANERTPLWLAAYSRHTDICQHLIRAGADVHIKDVNGRTAQEVANQTEDVQLARIFRETVKRQKFQK